MNTIPPIKLPDGIDTEDGRIIESSGRTWICKSPFGTNTYGCRHDIDENKNVLIVVARNRDPSQPKNQTPLKYLESFRINVVLRKTGVRSFNPVFTGDFQPSDDPAMLTLDIMSRIDALLMEFMLEWTTTLL